jgi:hypothetical protein
MLLARLKGYRAWRRIFLQRLTEPLHLNLLSLAVAAFGTYRAKVSFDLVLRQHYAFGTLWAAERARSANLHSVTVVEFGVGEGTGLINLCKIAKRTSAVTGVEINVVGFDTGTGMPAPVDYRDHPDLYRAGDYAMEYERLHRSLPAYAKLKLGPLAATVPAFLETVNGDSPIGFVIVDVDYYSSSKDALALLADNEPGKYLPISLLYLDDVLEENHNDWCGELLAVREFNDSHAMRKLQRDRYLKHWRVFKNAVWLDQTYLVHILDHPKRQSLEPRRKAHSTGNPYLESNSQFLN